MHIAYHCLSSVSAQLTWRPLTEYPAHCSRNRKDGKNWNIIDPAAFIIRCKDYLDKQEREIQDIASFQPGGSAVIAER